MAITPDAASPAAVTNTSTPASIVTASFTPPANTMLVAMIACGWNAAGNQLVATVSDSGSHAWTKGAEATGNTGNGGLAAVWTTGVFSTSPGAITVTMAVTGWGTSGGGISLDLIVLDGAATSQTGAAKNTKRDQTATLTDASVSVTTTTVGSRVYGATDCTDTMVTWTPISGTGQDRQYNDSPDGITIAQWVSIPNTGTVTPGAAAYGGTMSAGCGFNTAALEILPAATAAATIPNKQLIIAQAINRSNFF